MSIMSLLGLTSLLILIIYGKWIISSYNTNKELLKDAYIYLVAVGIANFFASLSFGIIAYINGIGKIRESSFIGVFSTFNSLILYIIFIVLLKNSLLGGVIGLSISIILVKFIELVFYIYVYKSKYSLSIRKEKFSFNIEIKKIKELFSFMLPLLLNNMVFMVTVNLIFICFSRKGIKETAALGIADGLINYFGQLLLGIIVSSKIIIGRLLGKNKLQRAYIYAQKFIQIILLCSIICILLINLCASFYLKFYKVDNETLGLTLDFILIASFYFVPKTVNGLIVDGILRIGGDIKRPMIIDLVGIIIFGFLIAYTLTEYTHFNLIIIYILVNINEVFRCIFNYLRFKEKIWLKSLIN